MVCHNVGPGLYFLIFQSNNVDWIANIGNYLFEAMLAFCY